MCGRKYDSEVAERERAVEYLNMNGPHRRKRGRRTKAIPFPLPNFDIRPTNEHIVFVAEDGEPVAEVMKWGFQPEWSKMLLFNSRRDKLDGRVWSKAFRERRCVIEVAGFYEWSGPKSSRQPHAISYANHAPMVLAGLFVEHEGVPCYSIITTEPSQFMAKLHDREPVMLAEKDIEEYLFAKEPPIHLLKQVADGALVEFACAPLVKDKPPSPLVVPEVGEPIAAHSADTKPKSEKKPAKGKPRRELF